MIIKQQGIWLYDIRDYSIMIHYFMGNCKQVRAWNFGWTMEYFYARSILKIVFSKLQKGVVVGLFLLLFSERESLLNISGINFFEDMSIIVWHTEKCMYNLYAVKKFKYEAKPSLKLWIIVLLSLASSSNWDFILVIYLFSFYSCTHGTWKFPG